MVVSVGFPGEAPNCVTKSQQSGTLKAACDKGEGMGRNSTSQNLNERALNKSEEGRESTKERAVLVEKEGCASVVMYPDRHTAHVLLADGTIITGSNQADYEVRLSVNVLFMIQLCVSDSCIRHFQTRHFYVVGVPVWWRASAHPK